MFDSVSHRSPFEARWQTCGPGVGLRTLDSGLGTKCVDEFDPDGWAEVESREAQHSSVCSKISAELAVAAVSIVIH
jgi:hypothetical protein